MQCTSCQRYRRVFLLINGQCLCDECAYPTRSAPRRCAWTRLSCYRDANTKPNRSRIAVAARTRPTIFRTSVTRVLPSRTPEL